MPPKSVPKPIMVGGMAANTAIYLARVPLFAECDDTFIEDLASVMRIKDVKTGDFVVKVGEPGEEMFFIESGSVAVLTPSNELVCNLEASDVFGEMAVILSTPRNSSVIAVANTRLAVLAKPEFEQVLRKYPAATNSIVKIANERYEANLENAASIFTTLEPTALEWMEPCHAGGEISIVSKKSRSPEPPSGRCDFGVACANEDIYVFGGRRGDDAESQPEDVFNDMWKLTKTSWAARVEVEAAVKAVAGGKTGKKNPMEWVRVDDSGTPSPRYGHSVTFAKNKIVVFGGMSAGNSCKLGDMHVFYMDTKSWVQPDPQTIFPDARAFHAAVGDKYHLYIFGGETNGKAPPAPNATLNGVPTAKLQGRVEAAPSRNIKKFPGGTPVCANDLHILNSITMTWDVPVQVGDIPSPRCSSAVCVSDGTMFLYGGMDTTGSVFDDLHTLDITRHTKVWKKQPSSGTLPPALHSSSVAVGKTTLYLQGGVDGMGVTYDSLYICDTNTFIWSLPLVSGPEPGPRRKHAAFFIGTGNKMLFFGGIDEENNTKADLRALDTNDEEVDVLDAFVSMGGNADKSGCVKVDVVTRQLKSYGLEINLEAFLAEVDDDGNGEIEYEEFVLMMANQKAAMEQSAKNSPK